MAKQNALRNIIIRLNVDGTAERLDDVKLYKHSFGFIKLQVLAPVTPRINEPICFCFQSIINDLGIEKRSIKNHNLVLVKHGLINELVGDDKAIIDDKEYLLFENYLPQEFTNEQGDLKMTINYCDSYLVENQDGTIAHNKLGEPIRVITDILVASTILWKVEAGGYNNVEIELPINAYEASQINKIPQMEEDIATNWQHIERIIKGEYPARALKKWNATFTYQLDEMLFYEPVEGSGNGIVIKSIQANNKNNPPYIDNVLNTEWWTKISLDGSGGTPTPPSAQAKKIGEINENSEPPTTRPDGTPLVTGDWLTIDKNAHLPFTFAGLEITEKQDIVQWFNTWCLNVSTYQDTNSLPVAKPEQEAITPKTAKTQKDINTQNADFIKGLNTSKLPLTNAGSESLSGEPVNQQQVNEEFARWAKASEHRYLTKTPAIGEQTGEAFATFAEFQQAIETHTFYYGDTLTEPDDYDWINVMSDETHNGDPCEYMYQKSGWSLVRQYPHPHPDGDIRTDGGWYSEVVPLEDIEDWNKKSGFLIGGGESYTWSEMLKADILQVTDTGQLKKGQQEALIKEATGHLTLEDNVTSLAWSVFASHKFSWLTVNEGCTVLGLMSLTNCGNLERLELPSTLEAIEDEAIANCTALKEIIYNGTVEKWKNLTKLTDWNKGTGAYTVYCNDGIITRGEIVFYTADNELFVTADDEIFIVGGV